MRLREQSLVNSFGSLVLLGAQWLISVLLVRLNGYEDAGVFSLAMTVSNVFSTVANYGLRNYQLTNIDRKDSQGQYLLMRMSTALISSLLCAVYLLLNGNYSVSEKIAVLLYLLYSMSIVMGDSLMGSLQLKDRLELNGFSNILRGALCFALFAVTLLLSKSLLLALTGMAAGSILIVVFFDWREYRRLYPPIDDFRTEFIASLSLYREGFPVMLSTVIPMIITAFPRTQIQRIAGTEQLGVFSTVFTPAVILSTVIPPLLVGRIPVIAAQWRTGDHKALRKTILVEYLIVFAVSAAAMLCAFLLGKPVLSLVYGSSILPHFRLLYAALLVTAANCLCVCGNRVLIALEAKKKLVFFSGAALLVTLCLSPALITQFGIYGAAYVQIIAYTLQSLFQTVFIAITIANEHKKAR